MTQRLDGMSFADQLSVSKIEQRIIELVNQIKADGAYCCSLNEVRDMVEETNTVQIEMSCPLHRSYSFEIQYFKPVSATESLHDSDLRRRIALGFVTSISWGRDAENI
jgi:hypothetical protein